MVKSFPIQKKSSSNYFTYKQKLIGDYKSQKCKIEMQCNTPKLYAGMKEEEGAGSSPLKAAVQK